jgi:hypothetical protein
MSSQMKQQSVSGCAYCRSRGLEWAKHSSTECSELAVHICGNCKQKGHTKSRCTLSKEECEQVREQERRKRWEANQKALAEKKVKQEEEQAKFKANCWAAIANKNVPDALKHKFQEEKIAMELAEQKRKQAIQEEKKRLQEEREATKDEKANRWAQEMCEKYGYRWFYFVKEADYPLYIRNNCVSIMTQCMTHHEDEEEKAYWEHTDQIKQWDKEAAEKAREDERIYEHNKATMTEKEFAKWEWEKDEESFDLADELAVDWDRNIFNYAATAPKEYADYAFQRGICLDWRDKPLERARMKKEDK